MPPLFDNPRVARLGGCRFWGTVLQWHETRSTRNNRGGCFGHRGRGVHGDVCGMASPEQFALGRFFCIDFSWASHRCANIVAEQRRWRVWSIPRRGRRGICRRVADDRSMDSCVLVNSWSTDCWDMLLAFRINDCFDVRVMAHPLGTRRTKTASISTMCPLRILASFIEACRSLPGMRTVLRPQATSRQI